MLLIMRSPLPGYNSSASPTSKQAAHGAGDPAMQSAVDEAEYDDSQSEDSESDDAAEASEDSALEDRLAAQLTASRAVTRTERGTLSEGVRRSSKERAVRPSAFTLHPHFDHDLVHASLVSTPMHRLLHITTFDVGDSKQCCVINVQQMPPCQHASLTWVCVKWNSLSERTRASACAA